MKLLFLLFTAVILTFLSLSIISAQDICAEGKLTRSKCGLEFKALKNTVDQNATYTLTFIVNNTLNKESNFSYEKFVCRCDEKEGNPSGICIEYYPEKNYTGNYRNDCVSLGIVNDSLAPGESRIVNLSVTQYNNQLCGSFQADIDLLEVNGDSACKQGVVTAGVARLCTSCLPLNCGNGITAGDEQCDDGNNVDGDGCSAQCKKEEIKIIAHKIVCDKESDLPNWGAGASDINGFTAINFINSHPNCHFQENWSFQYKHYSGQVPNPGNNIEFAGSGWKTFGETDGYGMTMTSINISGFTKIWFREALKEGYINFTGQNTNKPVSAEFYCDKDVINYDNLEHINPQAGKTYNCIAFNGRNDSIPYCGDGIVNGNEQCEPPNTATCDSQCKYKNLSCIEAKNLGLLTGTIENGTGKVVNNAPQAYEVGLASYEKIDNNIDNQILFDFDTGVVQAFSNLTLSVDLPICAYQIDLFCGPVLQNFSGGVRYGSRLIHAVHSVDKPFCVVEECGNGILEQGEQCDDGNNVDNDACSNQCLLTICGDGVVQQPNSNGTVEFCDDGNLNNNDSCRNDCSIPICGDGIKDDNEQCDDGNNVDNDACSNSCNLPICGDNILQVGEQCEPPNTLMCNAQCLFTFCGDGVVQNPNGLGQNETCDDGNLNDLDSCNNLCEFTFCGDGIVNGNEQCDDGNNVDGDGCSAQCTVEICGNGIKEIGEECDDGNLNNNDSCRNDCSIPICGDGIKDANEQCDDGNLINNDGCTNLCYLPICGDGILQAGEQCDDGNLNNLDSCNNLCEFTFCGDGIKEIGEECDDGNNVDNDACSNSCTANECIDLDNDEVCDHIDMCPDSKPNEEVDQMGCDIFQFCMTKGLSCGLDCFYADWKDNEDSQFPMDCTVVVQLNNGIEQQPICVPTVQTEMCAN